ncbi:MAG: wax ester/triacylglycerol synthase family O-acyltransferase [Mycobacterium sp.]
MVLDQRPDLTIRLSGSDATFVLDEPVEPQHTLKIAVFDEQSSKAFRFERVSEALNAAVEVLPPMRWGVQFVPLGLGHPVWITDSAFNVRNHLRHARLPDPGTKGQLCKKIGEVASQPVPAGQPPWELWFLEGFEGNKVVAVLKMNHALADGGTFADLLDLMTRSDPNSPPIVPPIPTAAARASRGAALRDGTRDLWHGVRHELPQRTRAMLRAYTRDRKTLAQRPPSRFGAPALPWRGPLTPPRSFSWVSLPLDEVKQIAQAISGTVNDVVLAIVARTVRQYLAEEGMLTDRPVIANTAVRTRKEGDTRLWGTAVTAVPCQLPTHLSDPLECLRAAHAQTAMVKAEVANRPVHAEDWFDFAPPFLLRPALKLTRLAARRVGGALIVSNVKGPREKRYVGGMGIENFISCGHLKYAAGVNTTVWSYDKLLNFTVYGCSRTLPDAELYTQRIQAAFEELRSATSGLADERTDPPKPAPAAPSAVGGDARGY